MNSVKTKLAIRMSQFNITQSKLAKVTQLDRQSVYLWYHGKVMPSIESAKKIARVLEDSIENLF